MVRYLHLFETTIEHDLMYNGNLYCSPWVGYAVGSNGISFDRTDYKNIPGSIIYVESNGTIKATSRRKWNSSLGTPIGIVVIPASHMADGKCRGVSLCNMSYVTPDTGSLAIGTGQTTTCGLNLRWGGLYADTSLFNYTTIMYEDGQTTDGNRILPSDLWKGRTSTDRGGTWTSAGMTTINNPIDTATAWYTRADGYGPWSPPFIISPYAADGSRSASADTSGQALADINGKASTSVIVNRSAIKDTYTGGSFSNTDANYPAAFACYLFNTQGTSQGDWYLPAFGELAYLYVREGVINQSLAALGNSAVQIGNYTNDMNNLGYYYWSSTEYSNRNAWYMSSWSNGTAYSSSKSSESTPYRTRAFHIFDI